MGSAAGPILTIRLCALESKVTTREKRLYQSSTVASGFEASHALHLFM
jgi:hypothetical protein